jgi:crotonobetainyl-CoA:carnitine CoA-transferase CaiB-like acyl-CoA transferase
MGALSGVRLLDFGQYLAGPFGPAVLADMGAEVIKIEPVGGDGMRMAGKPFFACQRGKRDIALNVKLPEGRAIALELVKTADVVHHNMTKGVATRLGIDYEACRAVKSDIIYCNTYAYGKEGPLSASGGLDPLYQASAGLEYESAGVHLGNAPLYYRFGMTDAANALLSAYGVVAALYHRARTGEGQEFWTSLMDGAAMFSSDMFLVDGTPWDRPRIDKNLRGTHPLYRLYATQDDSWIQIVAATEREWTALCTTLGVPDTATDARFATPADRLANRGALEAILEAQFLTHTAQAWHNFFDEAGVPNEVPLDPQQGQAILWDADNVRLGLTAEYEHKLLGTTRQYGQLINYSDTPFVPKTAPPIVGQDTEAILHELGYDDDRIAALEAAGVIYRPGDDYAQRFTN